MNFEDRADGDYRIHAGSLELRADEGFVASVIVNRVRSINGQLLLQEIYRNIEISGGHRWLSSNLALKRAMMLGSQAVAAERIRSAVCDNNI